MHPSGPCPSFSSSTSEERWVSHTSRNYTINLDTLPCIFQVPQKLRNENPEAYTPQILGLGPYHHLRPELHEMESQKRASFRSFLDHNFSKQFIDAVKEKQLEHLILNERRNSLAMSLSFYDTYLDLDSKTLWWILVIDGIFLRQFLEDELKWQDQRMVAEIMMLENQIPLVMLEDIKEILPKAFLRAEALQKSSPCDENFQKSFYKVLDLTLLNQFKSFCVKLSPLKLSQDSVDTAGAFKDTKHLLHFLYVLILENYTTKKPSPPESVPDESPLNSGVVICEAIGEVARVLANGVSSVIKQAQTQCLQIPGAISNVPKLIEQLEKTSDFYDNRDKNLQQELADKIDVPSASQLCYIAKIKFCCTDGGIRYISFDDKENILYLPQITLIGTSEVVLRNLVAYEAATEPAGSVLELAEYVDLMCGIIKAENDVKLLREVGIIKGILPDEQIVRIFNGINKTTQIPPEPTEIQRIVQRMLKVLQDILFPHKKKNPLTKKIMAQIHSVTFLNEDAEFKFACTGGGERKISFDENNRELQLPEINLGNDPEKALKVLAADEPEYADFMCAIIHTEEDVKFLKQQVIGIIKVVPESLEVEKIFKAFNQIRKPVEWPNELSLVQKTVHKLNNKFWSIRKVKAYKLVKRFCSDFQRWIKRIFPTLVLILLILQTFCGTFGCRAQRSGHGAVQGGSSFGIDNSEVKLMMPRKVLGFDPNLM